MTTTTMSLQLGRSLDEQMKKLYEQINEHYKTINRELINKIVHRFNEIINMYFDFAYSHINNEKEKEKIEESKKDLLPKLILRNEELPEAQTFDIVLNLVDMVFSFMSKYDHRCYELFDFHIYDKLTWLRYNVYAYNMERKYKYMFNDCNIPSTVERFLNISNIEIWHLLMLNFPNANYEAPRKWRSFDGITNLPYPSFKNEK